MTEFSRRRLARLRADLECPHCERLLSDPPSKKQTDEELIGIAMKSLDDFTETRRREAHDKAPGQRTFQDWAWMLDFSYSVTGSELAAQLTRIRDQVAADVR